MRDSKDFWKPQQIEQATPECECGGFIIPVFISFASDCLDVNGPVQEQPEVAYTHNYNGS